MTPTTTKATITDYRFMPMLAVPSVLWIWVRLEGADAGNETTMLEIRDSSENLKRRFGLVPAVNALGNDARPLVDRSCELRKGGKNYSLLRILPVA